MLNNNGILKNKTQLLKYYEQSLLRFAQKDDLIIVNYTEHATYINAFNDPVIIRNRGCVYKIENDNETLRLIMPSMPKFFNLFQLQTDEQKRVTKWLTDGTKYKVTQKMDGCLISIFPFEGRLIITSRGSFDNYVVKAAERIIKDKIFINDLETCSIGLWAELICPETHQVVNYGNLEEIRVITSFDLCDTHEGYLQEYEYEWTKSILDTMDTGVKMVEQMPFTFEQLQKWTKEHDYSEEGFVVQNIETGERVKFKSEDYLRVAAIKANMNMRHLLNDTFANIDNWKEHLYEIIKGLPDEAQPEAKELIKVIENTYKKYEHEIIEAADKVKDLSDKELGMLKDPEINKWKPCIFNIRKGSSNNRIILNRVRDEILSMEEFQ